MTEHFRCRPLSATLSREACAAKHRRSDPDVSGGLRAKVIAADACHRCPVGAAHARGEAPTAWPDGEQLVVLGAPSRAAPSASESASTKLELRGVLMHRGTSPAVDGRRYAYKGERLTRAGWARRLGISYDALRMRLRTKSLAEAIEMGGPGGSAAEERARTAARSRVERALRKAGVVVVEVVEVNGEILARCAP